MSGPSGKLKSEKMSVVAEFALTFPGGTQTIRSFDKAWHLALELPMPVNVKLTGFVRKTEAEMSQPL